MADNKANSADKNVQLQAQGWVVLDQKNGGAEPKTTTATAAANAAATTDDAKSDKPRNDDIPRSKPIPIPPRPVERRWEVPDHRPPQ